MTTSNAPGAATTATEPATARECHACQARAKNEHSGRVHFQCLPCCANLVASTNPNLELAEAMFAAISRSRDAPDKAQIWGLAKELLRAKKQQR